MTPRAASRHARRAGLVVAALVALSGCARRESRTPAATGPAPRDSLLAAIAPRLEPWMSLWGEAVPGFTLDSLRLAVASPFRPDFDQTMAEAFFDSPRRRRLFYRWSRDSAYAVDPNVYLDLGEDGELMAEPDNAVALIDRREGRWERLMSCGTPCQYFDALWVGDRVFAEAAWYESDDTPGRWSPALHVFDLAGHRSWRYDGPAGGPERLEAFRHALERRLTGHALAVIP